MINCPECGAQHYPGTLFCDTCGAAVHPAAQAHVDAGARAGSSATGTSATAPAAVRAAAPQKTAPPVRPRTEEVARRPAKDGHSLRVRLPHHDAEFILRGALLQVGRADPDTGFFPELDLTPYGGQERGVSRHHATIQWAENSFVLTDQHSTNGTWINGIRLVAGYTYHIPPGANVRFGGLVVQLAIAD